MTRSVLVFNLVVTVFLTACGASESAETTPCAAVLGQWSWFTQGVVTFNADGTVVHEPGNEGSWQCDDADRVAVSVHWQQGGFVNRLALSEDGHTLSSTDPSQAYVRGSRGAAATAAVPAGSPPTSTPSTGPLVLATRTVNGQILAMDLPELMVQATLAARTWREDAVPVSLEYQYLDPPNPALKGPSVRLAFLSLSDGTGQFITVTPKGSSVFTFNQPVTWGSLSLPGVFIDLPVAARIAIEHGAQRPMSGANLRVWSPPGAPPVLAWMLGGKTLEGRTGEIIDFDVTGYVALYNEQWERAARGLRALLRAGRGGGASGGPSFYSGGDVPDSTAPYDDGSTDHVEHERNAAEARAYWGTTTEEYNRIKSGECSWSASSSGYC